MDVAASNARPDDRGGATGSARTLSEDVDVLGRCLGAVIREQEGVEVLDLEERVRIETKRLREQGEDTAPMQAILAAISPTDVAKLVRAFSLYFQLVNVAEEHERIRSLARRSGTRHESLEAAFKELHRAGHDAASARHLLVEIDLGLTFTAHPTEMRRRTVRGHLDAISALLPDLENDAAGATDRIAAHVEALWTTPQLRARRPLVKDEVNAGLAYVDVIGDVLPALERDMKRAFEAVFGEPLGDVALPLSFHSWVGGDRDGNPNVTPEVTRDTFALHAARARDGLLRTIRASFGWLSQEKKRPLGDDEPGEEPYREALRALYREVDGGGYVDVTAKVAEIESSLREASQPRSAEILVQPLRDRARSFGVHLASLDIREHSKLTGAAVGELLERAGVTDYVTKTEEEKRAILTRELETRRPLLAAGEKPSEALHRVLGPLFAARDAIAAHGEEAFGRYVVSMSEQPSDLLEVLVLAREVGVDAVPTPLFETLDDLARAPDVVRDVLAMPAYRRALGDRVQEIMIGYSDSNKDGGFFAASFALYEAQERVAEVCAEANVPHRFFHGRGTSIGRGGGPMARGLLAQPPGTMGHGLRTTEQGEALGNKYSHPRLAFRNLEQGLYGLVVAAGRAPSPLPDDVRERMPEATAASAEAYRALVEMEGFLPFFEAVTPINEISRLQIASRPVRRPGAPTLQNLRAIPWVMAWTQCRANVPGWYGLRAALDALGDRAAVYYERWPFFRSMLDNAQMSLAKSDVHIFRAYRALAADDTLGAMIEEELSATIRRVEEVTGRPLLHDEPVLARSIVLRNPYIDPIHRLQVELLRDARKVPEGEPLPPMIERPLLLTLHGVAAGMRSTG